MKIIALLLLLTVVTSTRAADSFQIISSLGTYTDIAGGEKISLSFNDQKLTITRLKTRGGVVFKAAAGWKLYADTKNFLWLYDGMGKINRIEFDSGGIGVREIRTDDPISKETPKPFTDSITSGGGKTQPSGAPKAR